MKKKITEDKTSLISHFAEFRKSFLHCLIFFLIAFGISYLFAEDIFRILAAPLGSEKMIFTKLTEGFTTYLRVSFFAALFISIPYILLEIWKFVSPALYEHERKAILPFLILVPALFYLGGFFVYSLVIPNAWHFFLSFQSESIELTARISDYLSLIMSLILAFGLCFELPIVLVFLAKLGIVNYDSLKKFRKYFIVLAFTLGAILTPPDVVSQLFLATSIILLFELSLLGIRLMNKNII